MATQIRDLGNPQCCERPEAAYPSSYDPCNYHAGHRCRKCRAHITDMEVLASGLFLSLCPPCLASARQTLRTMTGA
jgi:hypothetical protein